MASATLVSAMEASPSPSPSAALWADKLRQQLLLLTHSCGEFGELPISVSIDESVMTAPRRKATDPHARALAHDIARLLHPPPPDTPEGSLGSIIRYEKDVMKLRKYVLLQRKRTIELATEENDLTRWRMRILRQGPWDPVADPISLGGPSSLPMPVQIASADTFKPFFEHLRLGGSVDPSSSIHANLDATQGEEPYYGTATLEFRKGVVYSDRRMDLCKTDIGPHNIGTLIDSLKTNEYIKHFLLGNNIIGPVGAKCIADFLKEFPNRMDTWYLAGNCIDSASLKLLVDQWVLSTSVTNIWLKRNPLHATAADDILRLITQTPKLRTLDLDQTELGDLGVAKLFSRLAKHESLPQLPLRNLYLNAVGIGESAATAIGEYLASPHCALESLYMSNNPMGSRGIIALSAGLTKNNSLTRLSLQSSGMADEGVIALCKALSNHPKIRTLDIGHSYSTPDLGTRYNWVSDPSADAICNLIHSSSTLAYLTLGFCALTHTGLDEIYQAVLNSPSLLVYQAKSIHPPPNSGPPVTQTHKQVSRHLLTNMQRVYGPDMDIEKFQAREKRWLINDETDVRKIDSVYRNRQAGLARRGIEKLDKWWPEEDETLNEIMRGAVGPTCTLKRNAVKV